MAEKITLNTIGSSNNHDTEEKKIIVKLLTVLDDKKEDAKKPFNPIIEKMVANQELSDEEKIKFGGMVDAMKAILPNALYDITTKLIYAESSTPPVVSSITKDNDQNSIPDFWSWIASVQNYLTSISTWQKEIQGCITSEAVIDLQSLKAAVRAIPAPVNPPAAAPVSIFSNLFFKGSESK